MCIELGFVGLAETVTGIIVEPSRQQRCCRLRTTIATYEKIAHESDLTPRYNF